MNHGSLESGIGMFDYAAEQMGWDNVFHCEINPFCRTILNYYWPKAKSYANVFGFDGTAWRGKVDIITAGFPCQPFSHAGKREGSKDDRHIWPENMRIFREAQPTFIVAENVPGLLTIENGMVFEQVCLDLENEGYEVTPFIIPAVATDKDHRRDRVWIVAYSESIGKRSRAEGKGSNDKRGQFMEGAEPGGNINHSFINHVTNTSSERLSQSGQTGKQQLQTKAGTRIHDRFEQCDWNAADPLRIGQQGPGQHRRPGNSKENGNRKINRTFNGNQLKETWLEAATRLCSMDDGDTRGLDLEAISKSKWRTESLKAYGNTIIWEIAYNIFKAIEETTQIQSQMF